MQPVAARGTQASTASHAARSGALARRRPVFVLKFSVVEHWRRAIGLRRSRLSEYTVFSRPGPRRHEEHVEPSDALFNVVEASLVLAGFAGIVSALGQRGAGHWRQDDRDRMVYLLEATLIPFASALLALTLMYADVGSVWRISSTALVLPVLANAVVVPRRIWKRWNAPDFSASASYIATICLSVVVLVLLQLVNLRFNSFWPYFAGLAVSLCVGVIMFVRLLWLGIQGARERSG